MRNLLKNIARKNPVRYYIGFGLIIIGVISYLLIKPFHNNKFLYTSVKKGAFEVTVTTSGELEAKNSVKVYGPQNLANANIFTIKIADIVAEGTSVKKGDYIAQLDPAAVTEAINNVRLEVDNILLEMNQAKIDTAIELQQARNNLENLKSSLLEKKLEVEKSIYEPPVIIKQAEAAYERAQRDFEQSLAGYSLTKDKAEARVKGYIFRHQSALQRIKNLQLVLEELTIYAPQDGMVIYRKDHQGEKHGKNANVNPWDPIVAELPDLNILISKTYVNEVDISNIKIGQEVEVSFDAFPSKYMSGEVIFVANIGETVYGGNAKVFRVDVLLDGSDKKIKPGMTTKNSIMISKSKESLFIPIETVFSQDDSLYYVYLKEKANIIKKEVRLGNKNELNVEVLAGISENQEVLFLPPENANDLNLILLNTEETGRLVGSLKE